MTVLRRTLITWCLLCTVGVAGFARWEARHVEPEGERILDLGRAPVWSPPAVPSYAWLRRAWFLETQGKSLLPESPSGRLECGINWASTLADLLVLLCPAFLLLGTLHVVVSD